MAESEQDFALQNEDEVGVIRQLRYAPNELAVLDVTNDVTVANWTSDIVASSFFRLVTDLTDLDEKEPVFYFASEYVKDSMHVQDMRAISHVVMESCQFMRINLNESRSVAWELITLDDRRVPIVGYGDDTTLVASGDVGFVEKLLYATISPAMDPHEIFNSMTTLARQHGRGTTHAGSGLLA